MHSHKENAAILNYAIKVLRNQPVTDNAKLYIVKTVLHLAILYPYLTPLLFDVKSGDVLSFTNKIYKLGLATLNYEAVSYSLFFAVKYCFKIDNISVQDIISSNSTITMLMSYKYFELFSDSKSLKILRNIAENFAKNGDMDSHWLFVYEVLPKSKLSGEWKPMKTAGVSFFKSTYLNLVQN